MVKKTERVFSQAEEEAQIAEFLRTKDVTRCPTVFSAPTQTELTSDEEQQRLKGVKPPEKLTRQEVLDGHKRVVRQQRQWHEARQTAAIRQTGPERA